MKPQGRGNFLTALILLGAALAILSLSACRSAPPRPNILMIVIDTLRADRLGCYGNQRGLTPFLDSLAERGFVFRHAYAQSSWTNPSVASLFTSRFPSQHKVTSAPDTMPMPGDGEWMLAQSLSRGGYRNAAVVANAGLRGYADRQLTPSKRVPGRGFGKGFDLFVALAATPNGPNQFLWVRPRAEQVNQQALAWLRDNESGAPVFLYLQYMETHQPYAPTEAGLARASRGGHPPDVKRANVSKLAANRRPLEPDELRNLEDVYDAEVASVDAGVRDLFAALDKQGFLKDAIVVVTADHGEEFGAHGVFGHGVSLYEPEIHVPLLVLVPHSDKRVDVDEDVSLIDLAPTLLDWIDAPVPASFEGRSIVPILNPSPSLWRRLVGGPSRSSHPAFSELICEGGDWKRVTPHRYAVVEEGRKLIADGNGNADYFDVAEDPQETQGKALRPPERLALLQALERFRLHVGGKGTGTGAESVDPATLSDSDIERLRALGYHE
jgi:arylsulfatase A-like enzyme